MNTILGNKKNLIIVGLGVFALIAALLFFAFRGVNPGGGGSSGQETKAEILMWGVWDNSSLMNKYIEAFEERYPNVSITYRKRTIENYEQNLTNALAEQRGPDIFAAHHTWLNKHKGKMAPAPKDVMSEKAYRERFLQVVEEDFLTEEGRIYGFPLYTDSLALYYNRDMFDDAGIVDPPETWEEFQDVVKQLTRLNERGRITRAGATLGTADNINRSPDLVQVIMAQNLAQRDKALPNFGNEAGQRALRFYTDFANPTKTVYTWNSNQNYSIDAFANGKAAMTIGYAYLAERIEAKSPRLNFEIAKLPQISTQDNITNFTNYWGYTVSPQTNNTERQIAYTFLKFLTSKENSQTYFNETNRPTPREDLIEKQSEDLKYGVFAEQLLNITTWKQPDNEKVDSVLKTMVRQVNNNAATIEEAIDTARSQIQTTQ